MMKVVGLMSGTSLDGVDAAVLETDGEAVGAQGPRLTIPYPPALRAALRLLLDRAPSLAADDPDLLAAERQLTDRHAEAVRAVLEGGSAGLVGFHGQTILHRPDQRRTWQIGDASRLSRALGMPVACDFRLADVATGGQGAPLAPLYHAALAAGLARPLAVLNLGGVGNVTWLGEGVEAAAPPPPHPSPAGAGEGALRGRPDSLSREAGEGRGGGGATASAVIACDTGPGNALLDDFVLRRTGAAFDQDGRLAASGRVAPAVIARLMADPYFAAPPPKSLDRLDFSARVAASGLDALSDADGAATLVAFTARSVAAVVPLLPAPPRRWLVGGGGRHNLSIMTTLAGVLGVPVAPVEAAGWDGDALEAQAFAFLAARVARGLPLSLPGTTGVPWPMPGGRMVS